MKTLFKLFLLLIFAAVLGGVLTLVKRRDASGPVSFDEWPAVPENPAA
jgi:hypothetical protein